MAFMINRQERARRTMHGITNTFKQRRMTVIDTTRSLSSARPNLNMFFRFARLMEVSRVSSITNGRVTTPQGHVKHADPNTKLFLRDLFSFTQHQPCPVAGLSVLKSVGGSQRLAIVTRRRTVTSRQRGIFSKLTVETNRRHTRQPSGFVRSVGQVAPAFRVFFLRGSTRALTITIGNRHLTNRSFSLGHIFLNL